MCFDRLHTAASLSLALAVASLTGWLQAQDWPSWRGPDGKGTAEAVEASALIANPAKARLVWQSQAQIPPSGNNHLGKWSTGFSSPCVADGRVFLFWYEGDEQVVDPAVNLRAPPAWLAKTRSVGANEVVLCVDAKTGETLWQRSLAGQGVNIQGSGSGKVGGHFSMAAADGKAFAIGTNGHVSCFDAASGELLWQGKIGPTEAREQALAEALEKRSLAGVAFGKMGGGRSQLPNACPVYADGVVWVHDTAFDADSGAVRWRGNHGNGTPSPVVWRHAGKNYFISGAGVCVEPGSGQVRWRAEPTGRAGSGATPAIGSGYLVLGGAVACFKIGPDRCEKVWQLDAGGGADMSSSAVIHGDYLYANTSHPAGHRREREKYGNAANLICIELATGREVCRLGAPSNSGSLIALGPWIITERAGAGGNPGMGFYRADPVEDTLTLLAELRYPGPFQDSVTPAVVGSRIYLRGAERLYCFELGR